MNISLDSIPASTKPKKPSQPQEVLPELTTADAMWHELMHGNRDALQVFEALEKASESEQAKFIEYLKKNDMEARFVQELAICACT